MVEAAAELRAFLGKQSFRAESWALLGHLLAKLHNLQPAIDSFEEAMRLDIRDHESRHRRDILLRIKAGAPG